MREVFMHGIAEHIGRAIAAYLDGPASHDPLLAPSHPAALCATIRPGDVLLVEGSTHLSGMIKYLTQSTWSHAALSIGCADRAQPMLIEANLEGGVVTVPLSKYFASPTRICRPVGLTPEHCKQVCNYALARIGSGYDLKNIFDLARYLVPLPVPQRWRRRMIALGSGDPTKLICSGMIAAAFQSVRYPILPSITREESGAAWHEVMEIRSSSLFAPRDFDLSPYFAVVKPTLETGFDYRQAVWATASTRSAAAPDTSVAAA
jgi:hypothetical protein